MNEEMLKYANLGRLYLREMQESDRKAYGEALIQEPGIENATETLIDIFFEFVQKNSSCQIYSIVLRCTDEMCGFCQVTYEDDKLPKVGINLRKEYQGKEYGAEALSLMIKKHLEGDPDFHCILKTENSNRKCIRMCEKMGLSFEMEEENPMCEMLQKLESMESNLLNLGIDKAREYKTVLKYRF